MVIRTSHVVTAILLHVIVIGSLLIGFRCTRKAEAPPIIQATIIDSKPAAKPKPAEPEPPKPDERKQREEEQHKKEQQLAQEKKAEQLEQQKQEDQRKAQAADNARQQKQEQERKAKEEQEKREADKKKKEQELQDQLRKEMSSEEVQRKSAATASSQNAWVDAIRSKVIPNFNPPPGAPDDFHCRVHVSLLPGGQVVGVKLMESCGNPILDASVERAIRKSDPLPTPDNPAAFERELDFEFVPHL